MPRRKATLTRSNLSSGAALGVLLALAANGVGACSDYRTCERLRTCVVPGGAGGVATGGTVGAGGASGGVFQAAGQGGTEPVGAGGSGGSVVGGGEGGGAGSGATSGCADGLCGVGGQPVGGSLGASGESGAGAGGAPVTPAGSFRNGPCAVSPDGKSVEVFARGRDTNIYRTTVAGGSSGWERLADLDGSLIDNRSDLDCSGISTNIDLVALGRTPPGAYLHANGVGSNYNDFVRELTDAVFAFSPSVFANGNSLLAGVTEGGSARLVSRTSAGKVTDASDLGTNFTSGVDVWWETYTMTDIRFVAGFDTSGNLLLHMLKSNGLNEAWLTPVQLAPPTGLSFQYSPSVCASFSQAAPPPMQSSHLVAVAGDRLWHAYATMDVASYSAWEKMSDTAVFSAPDCTLTAVASGGVLHVVALTSSGTVVDVHGTAGSFVTTDLGAY